MSAGDISSTFRAFQPTNLQGDTEVDVSFSCTVEVCMGECQKVNTRTRICIYTISDLPVSWVMFCLLSMLYIPVNIFSNFGTFSCFELNQY